MSNPAGVNEKRIKKMSEIKFRYKFDSTAYVVDEAYFLKMERMAKMNGEKIEKTCRKEIQELSQ